MRERAQRNHPPIKENDVPFQHLTHTPTLTSEASAQVRGTPIELGIKALILRGKQSKKNYQVNLPAHLKADMKAVAQLLGEKCEFETKEVILERFGLEIGASPLGKPPQSRYLL